ncbi:pancreatic triacylglycerol lipase-like [Papilio machaon]|uniref:pancreatic triacylglycerol lipase-like n=1 Tax=Papilio machaon TaxID=76193 RepID=UPI001E66567A|nr:pancreatic triacylglycerol lipase-like [Papilio machaon]
MFTFTRGFLLLCAAVAATAFELRDGDVVFHLFTRANPQLSQPLLPSVASIMTSSFSVTRRTIVTIHSDGEGVTGNFNAFVVQAHLSVEDVNVIAVDWSPGSAMYTQGLGNAPQAGRIIAQFINILINNFGYNAGLIRIVGVGLGGHIAGIAARNVNGEIPHIVALDPSLHGWTHHPEILNQDDAAVVEVLHTTAGLKGYDYPLGDLDFYSNGGQAQSGCGTDVSCSHIYSYVFYAESITAEIVAGRRFVGTACQDYETAMNLQCTGPRDSIFGGSATKTDDFGVYMFLTNFVSPFARD